MTADDTSLIDACLEAAERYQEWLIDDDAAGDGFDLDETWKEAVQAFLLSIPGVERLTADYEAQSSYYDLWFTDADGEEASVEVRVSNHKQAHSGPVYSLLACDDALSYQFCRETVIEAMAGY